MLCCGKINSYLFTTEWSLRNVSHLHIFKGNTQHLIPPDTHLKSAL